MSPLALAVGSYRAEWLKLTRRPAIWILGIILCACVFTLGYALLYLASEIVGRTAPSPTNPDPGLAGREIRATLVPANAVAQIIPLLSSLGGPIGLILGALTIGSEYSWGTLKTILTQRAGRLSLGGGKLLALAPLLLLFSAAALIVGLLGSLLFTAIDGGALGLPSALTLLKGLGAGWLVLVAWTALGVALATLFRSSALAIGLGLIYALVLETVVGGIAFFVEAADWVRQALLGANATALVNYVGSDGTTGAAGRIPPERATLVLLLYTAAFLAVTLALLRRRDVA